MKTRLFGLLLALMMVTGATRPALCGVGSTVVNAVVNGAVADDAFGVEMAGDTVLLPLLATGRLLGVDVTWDPASLKAFWVRPSDRTLCQYQTGLGVFIAGKDSERPAPGTVLVNSVPFVPAAVIEKGMECEIRWVFAEQALFFSCPRLLKAGPDEQLHLADGRLTLTADPPEWFGPVGFRFSLIHDSSTGTDWSLDAGGRMTAGALPVKWTLGLGTPEAADPWGVIRTFSVTVKGELSEVVLGDSTYAIPGMIEEVNLRGVRVSLPPGRVGETGVPVVDLSGPAADGSTAELYVNGHILARCKVEGGEWRFSRIPLNLIAPTRIRIVVTDPWGQTTVFERDLIASQRLEPEAGFSESAAFGWLAGSKGNRWNSALLGVDTRYGITDDLTATFSMGSTRRRPVDPGDDAPFTGTVSGGLLWRLSDPLLASFDCLMSVRRDPDEAHDFGWRAGVQYGSRTYGFKGALFHYGPAFWMPLDDEPQNLEGLAMAASWYPTSNLTLTGDYKAERPVLPDASAFSHEFGLGGTWYPALLGALNGTARLWLVPDGAAFDHRAAFALGLDHHSNPLDLSATWSGQWWDTAGPWDSLNQFSLGLIARFSGVLTGRFRADGTLERDLFHYTLSPSLSWQFSRSGVLTALGCWENPDVDGVIIPGTRSLYGGLNLHYTWPEAGLTAEGEAGCTAFFPTGTVVPHMKLGLTYETAGGLNFWANGQLDAGSPARCSFKIGVSQAIAIADKRVHFVANETSIDGGFVSGVVFEDLNANGTRDPGEPAMAGIPVVLGCNSLRSGPGGVFSFMGVTEGTYMLGVDETLLAMRYRVTTPAVTLKMVRNGHLVHDLGIALNGTISGRVFIDANHNGMFDDGDTPAPDVFIRVNGKWTDTCTDEQGFFYLEGLQSGTYTLTLDPSGLPEDISPETIAPIRVIVSPERFEIDACDFIL